MNRASLFCPGRGSYNKKSLGSLASGHPWVKKAEKLRAERGLPSLLELDGKKRFHPPTHLLPANVSPLIYLVTMIDAQRAKEEQEIVSVGGNSMGWYTALGVAGALEFEDGFRLVQEMSILQQEAGGGGQILFPLVGDDWHYLPRLVGAMNEALAALGGEAFPSIDLGGYAVLSGTERGIELLLEKLPQVELGSTMYPIRLAQHGPYHTSILEGVAEKARERLGGLGFRCPAITLIDGRGARHSPWSADPDELRSYTLGDQIVTPYGFTTSVSVALREDAPDRIVLPGPGNTLGGICGQILVQEGYRGIRNKEDFDAVQSSDSPVVASMRR